VFDLSLWKYSFELVTKELDLAKKKKQALDNLLASDKISRSTYDYLEGELTEAMADLESHIKTLMNKMNARAQDLESQLNTLEVFLASLEIHHAAGDIDDETYDKQNKAILLGLDATRQELNDIKGSLSKTVSGSGKLPKEEPEPEVVASETVESSDPMEIEEEESEVGPSYELTEPAEPSHEMTSESSPIEPSESEVPPPVFHSVPPSPEFDTTED